MSTKILREIEEIAEKRGWAEVSRTSGGHIQMRHPNEDVPLVHTGTSPSDHRWRENLQAQLRQAEREGGLTPPEDEGGGEQAQEQAQDRQDRMESQAQDGEYCRYCEEGPFHSHQKRVGHEDTCDENPDLWKTCPDCGKPCKGKKGLAGHAGFCPEKDRDTEPETEPEEAGKEDVDEAKVRNAPEIPSREGKREKIRQTLIDLLREYDETDDDRPLVAKSLAVVELLDLFADMILEIKEADHE